MILNSITKGLTRKNFVCTVYYIILFSAQLGYGQVQTAMPFLNLAPSPLLNGMGQLGTALPNQESFGLFYNPAHTGRVAEHSNLGIQFYPTSTDWLPGLNFSDLKLNNFAVHAGYKFSDIFNEMSLGVGIGYLNSKLDLGENVFTDENGNVLGTADSKESFYAIGIGINLEYYAQLSFGVNYKNAESELGIAVFQVGQEAKSSNPNVTALDWGLLLYVPVLKFYTDEFKLASAPEQIWSPILDVSLGYAKTNIGDPVDYYFDGRSLPLPRSARLGYAVSAGIEWYYKKLWFEFFTFDYSVDAVDLLIQNDPAMSIQNGLLGDISFSNNLLRGNADENVTVHKGYRIGLFETVYILGGKWDGDPWGGAETAGYAISLRGLFKVLGSGSDSPILSYLGNHFDIQYTYSDADAGDYSPVTGTEFRSIAILYHNVPF
jgi:hypothetical protein